METLERAVCMVIALIVAVALGVIMVMIPVKAAGEAEFEVYEDVPLTAEEQQVLQQVCAEDDICFEFALAMIESESRFKADALGDCGRSVGYFQINKVNWPRWKEKGLDAKEPLDNLQIGVHMLRELADKYEDPYEVIICYKAGECRGKKLYKAGRFKTKQYDCQAICDRAAEWEREHEK